MRLGVVLAVQLLFSTELLVSLVLALALSLAAGYWLDPSRRPRLRSLVAPLAAACGLAVLLTAPLVVYALSGFRGHSVNPPGAYVADLLNIVVPTGLTFASGHAMTELAQHFTGNSSEQGSYLGLPLLAIVVLFLVRRRATPAGRFLIAVLVIGFVAALGAGVHVAGHRIGPGPWAIVGGLPLFNNLITARFALYLALATAAIVALWAAGREPRLWLRVALPLLAVIAILPQPRFGLWKVTPHVPAFFTDAAYRNCLAPGENVLIVEPQEATADPLLWQARAGFRFTIAGGEISPEAPESFMRFAAFLAFRFGEVPPHGTADVLALARAKHAGAILIDGRYAGFYRWLRRDLHPLPELGGMLVYRVDGRAATRPGCPARSGAAAAVREPAGRATSSTCELAPSGEPSVPPKRPTGESPASSRSASSSLTSYSCIA